MHKTMTVNEFVEKIIGIKWADRGCSFKSVDCWGLVILYYRHVLGIEVANINGYIEKTINIQNAAIPESLRNWTPCCRSNNSVFLAYIGDIPSHVGIVIDNYALHAKGNEIQGGQVQLNRLDAIEKTYTKIEYYKYANLS